MFDSIKKMLGMETPDYKTMVQQGATILDVRTTAEFNAGHIKGSVNIPVDQVAHKSESIRKMKQPIITCCLSGGRSGSAASILNAKGITAINGGPWSSLNQKIK
jgi:rhodanese-related sulfurtransferase